MKGERFMKMLHIPIPYVSGTIIQESSVDFELAKITQEVIEKYQPKVIFCEGLSWENKIHFEVIGDKKEMKKLTYLFYKYFFGEYGLSTLLHYPYIQRAYTILKSIGKIEEENFQKLEKIKVFFLDANEECVKSILSYFRDACIRKNLFSKITTIIIIYVSHPSIFPPLCWRQKHFPHLQTHH